MNILLIPDRLHWGTHRTSQSIQKYAGKHNIIIKEAIALEKTDFEDIDLAVSMLSSCRQYVHLLAKEANVPVALRIASWKALYRDQWRHKKEDWPVAGICVISPRLVAPVQRMYRRRKITFLPIGVDSKSFNCPPQDNNNEDHFVVGWVGRPHDLVKGYWWLQRKELKDYNIVTKLQRKEEDSVVTTRFPEEMVEFYNNLDVLICTSSVEGGPKVVLEAMSCRRAVISTPVGIVPIALHPKWIVVTPQHMANLLFRLRRNPRRKRWAGEQNRKTIEGAWDWKIRAGAHIDWFKECIE